MYKLIISQMLMLGWLLSSHPVTAQAPTLQPTVPLRIVSQTEIQLMYEPMDYESPAIIEEEPEEEYIVETELSDEDYDLLAYLVMAEAEDQSWDAQYGVACVVLNRMKSDLFPDTVSDVIYQKSQFTCVDNGRLKKVMKGKPSDSVMEAVGTALEHNDFPDNMYYFTSNGYLGGTKHYKKIDNMYFSLQRGE